uniref:Uncharacterized protein n=1 Tax=Candidatus Kentrum sp. DK TaxID=2126562 RepID=A0A450T846_9GAMM|nr:MAG: hypothetical protein BECKDK2373C_GA0170839_100154 [Candidatus Kentron sp. DK]VFJ62691.1 MAG: hypothetical protein BECKDK2373B_GA0170837_111411 [Candidatus Kentron sp. DK]
MHSKGKIERAGFGSLGRDVFWEWDGPLGLCPVFCGKFVARTAIPRSCVIGMNLLA